jgi:hypothetical protein
MAEMSCKHGQTRSFPSLRLQPLKPTWTPLMFAFGNTARMQQDGRTPPQPTRLLGLLVLQVSMPRPGPGPLASSGRVAIGARPASGPPVGRRPARAPFQVALAGRRPSLPRAQTGMAPSLRSGSSLEWANRNKTLGARVGWHGGLVPVRGSCRWNY